MRPRPAVCGGSGGAPEIGAVGIGRAHGGTAIGVEAGRRDRPRD
jgi:hypothetical protein